MFDCSICILVAAVITFILVVVMSLLFCFFCYQKKLDAADVNVPRSRQRFRTRDKVSFVCKKFMRKAKATGNYFLRRDELFDDEIKLNEAPLEYFQEDPALKSGSTSSPQHRYVLENFRVVFGVFEDKVFKEITKEVEYLTVRADSHLFKIGDMDECLFIVQSGIIDVYSTDARLGITNSLKHVHPGHSIMSLLSFLDHLAGHHKPYKTIGAVAIEDSKVMKLPFKAFFKAFEKYPDCYLRVVKMVLSRFQRVTLVALHQYLGLGEELIKEDHRNEVDADFKVPNESGEIMNFALKTFKELLKLKPKAFEMIQDHVTLHDVPPGFKLVEENVRQESALVLVLDGCFSVSRNDDGKDKVLLLVHEGLLLGQLHMLTGLASIFTVKATKQCKIARISRQVVFNLMSLQPDLCLTLAMGVVDRISPYVRSIDFALDWITVESGQELCREGQEADTYVVLNGRIRLVNLNSF